MKNISFRKSISANQDSNTVARKIYYKIYDDGKNILSEAEWEDIRRLQHWYNSEFYWTAGYLAFKMYAVFPNTDASIIATEDAFIQNIATRRTVLREEGLSENEIIQRLETEGLIISENGGYFDNC